MLNAGRVDGICLVAAARYNPVLDSQSTTAHTDLAEAAKWRALADRLDDPPECDPCDLLKDCVRRLEALLEDDFDASGRDLAEKASSVRHRVSSELLAEISAIYDMRNGPAHSQTISAVSAQCDRAIDHLLPAAMYAQPRTADGLFAYRRWMLRRRTLSGVVRKIRKYEEGRQHVAAVDVDGHLIEIKTPKMVCMDPGDRVVLLRRWKYDASHFYYNLSQDTGCDAAAEIATFRKYLVAGVAVFLAGIIGATITTVLAVRRVHGWSNLFVLLKLLVFGVPSVIAAYLGLFLFIWSIRFSSLMIEFRRAVDKGKQES